MSKIVVLIPAYNEQETIRKLILKIEKYPLDIVVIDDGSMDKTINEVLNTKARLIQTKHAGKGHALKEGKKFVAEKDYDYIICIDADLQHTPSDIPFFIRTIKKTNDDIIVGSRFTHQLKIPIPIKIVNRLHNWMLNVYLKIKLSDYACGYRIFKKNAFLKINWKSSGYGVEIEQIISAIKLGFNIREIPINVVYSSSQKMTFKKILIMTTEIHSTLYKSFIRDPKGVFFIFISTNIFILSFLLLIFMMLMTKIRRIWHEKKN